MTTETEGADLSAAEPAPVVETGEELAPETTIEGAETDPGDDAPAAAAEGAPKPKKSAKDRIDELTAKMREQEREAEYWRSKALQPQQQQTPAPQAAPAEDKEPDPADYTHGDLDAAFIRDHATFHARKTFREEQQQQDQRRAVQQRQSTWQAKQADAAAKYPDYQEKVVVGAQRNQWACTTDMAETIQESDVGPDIAYHLATNPGEARRIASLSPLSQARELGKLEAKLAAPATPQAKLKTDAPDPVPTLRGQGGRFEAAPDTDDFAAFERLAEKAMGG